MAYHSFYKKIPQKKRANFSLSTLFEKKTKIPHFSFYKRRKRWYNVYNHILISVGGITVQNKVTVTIAGQTYKLVAAEEPAYMEKVAAHVNAEITKVMAEAPVSLADGALLGALNVADQYFKELEAGEKLRSQLKEALEEAAALKLELAESKRKIFELQTRK